MRAAEPGVPADPSEDTRRWLSAAAAPGRIQLGLAAACQVLETVFTVLGWVALAWVAQAVLDGGEQPTWPALAILGAGGLLAAAAAWCAKRLQATGRRRISVAIRGQLVAGLLPPGRRRVEPDAATAALAIVESTDDVAGYHAQALPQRLSAPASMVVILLVTAVVQWPAAVVLLLATLLIPPNLRLAGVFAKEGADQRAMASARLAAVVLDSFRGMRTLQAIGALGRRREQVAEAAAKSNATTMAIVRRAFLSGSVMDVVITFSIAASATYLGLSLLGYVRLDAAPTVTLFSGLLALLLCPMYFQPLRTMATAYHARERALAGVPTITRSLPDAEGAPQIGEQHGVPPAGPVAVVVDEVTFRYPDSDRAVLHEVHLTVQPGSWTSIVGPSGAGKTTLLSLIAGVRQPTVGSVRWLTATGASPPRLGGCAWIGQQTVLLPGSIGDNIRIGRPTACRAEVQRAAAAAGLAGVVARLPDGLDTALGEGGWGLSTGEARRIAIARAFLRDAQLWVLDEPTAHLDRDAEAGVIDALQRATQGRTIIVATHSRALAGCADTMLDVAEGTTRPLRPAREATAL
jgi:ATP-binding cassette subfamily C protein CydD